MYKNYSLKSSNGKFYRSSKEKTDEFTVPAKDTAGNPYWHQEVNSLEGELVGLRLTEPPFGGEQLGIILQDGDDRIVIQFATIKNGDRVGDWVKTFSQYLDSLEIGDHLSFSLNQKAKDSGGYLYKNVYVKKNGEKVEWTFEWSDVPKPVETENKLTKKKELDYSGVDLFFYDIIKRNVERLAIHRDEPEQQEKAAVTEPEIETDDLPF